MRESVRARLAEVTAQDRELYKKASELHRAQIQRVRLGPERRQNNTSHLSYAV
jgi:hypothetical protein